jgi:hypothetical protein
VAVSQLGNGLAGPFHIHAGRAGAVAFLGNHRGKFVLVYRNVQENGLALLNVCAYADDQARVFAKSGFFHILDRLLSGFFYSISHSAEKNKTWDDGSGIFFLGTG